MRHAQLKPIHSPDTACQCSVCLMYFDKILHPGSHPEHIDPETSNVKKATDTDFKNDG